MAIDDFFACTIVVRNSTEITRATALVEDVFDIVERRPASSTVTKSRPTEFHFDDLRLYANLKESFRGRQPINDVRFEIQVKTFLQHAWAIATHDLTYKTDKVSWAKLRVASQIRAMLEHAELSIDQFDKLAGSEILAKDHKEFREVAEIIVLLQAHWESAALPRDLQRLAQTIRAASLTFDLSIKSMFGYLVDERKKGGGVASLDHSPYGELIQAVLHQHVFDGERLLDRAKKHRWLDKIMVSPFIDLPSNLEKLKGVIIETY